MKKTLSIWVKDKMIYEEEVDEKDIKEIAKNIEIMLLDDEKYYYPFNPNQ